MNIRKGRLLLFVAILVLILLFIFPFLSIAGGIIAAQRIEKYVCAVYGDENIGWYAKYSPVSSSYYMTIQRASGESIDIVCDKDGNIFDEYRSKDILDAARVERDFAIQNERDPRQFGYLSCCWKFDNPEVAIIILHIGIRECYEPFPETSEAMCEKMAERFAIYYDMLTAIGKEELSQAYISYQHYAENREDLQSNDNIVYSMLLNLKADGGSIKDKIYSSIITKEK